MADMTVMLCVCLCYLFCSCKLKTGIKVLLTIAQA